MKIDAEVNVNVDISAPERIMKSETLWKFAAQRWHVHYFEYVPMDTGNLAKLVRYSGENGCGTITHIMPYAHYQYYGNFNWSKDKHPLACGRWDQAAAASKLPVITREIQAMIYRELQKG